MAEIDRIWLATLTRNDDDDAGTDAGALNLTINVDGEDIFDHDFHFMKGSGFLSDGLGPDSSWLDKGQAALTDIVLQAPIDTSQLTNSSIRLGIRDDDAWAPQQVMLIGRTARRIIALALETDLARWMSTDSSEGKLTIPVRLVQPGASTTVIRRVMVVVYTGGGSAETDADVRFQIATANGIVLDASIHDTSQDDFEEYTANWHTFIANTPFTRSDVLSGGSIKVSINGEDTWRPTSFFMYGLDTDSGRPNVVVDLVALPEWTLDTLSTSQGQGKPEVPLPVL